MPTWAKILLAVLLVSIVGVGVCVYLGFHWVMQNKDTLASAVGEGKKYGEGKTVGQCVNASLAKLNGDLTSRLTATVFNAACLQSASDTATECATIPTGMFNRALWAKNKCGSHPDPQGCQQIYQSVWQHCDSRAAGH